MEHLEWLVQSRAANQQATVALFLLIKKHKRLISQRVVLQHAAEELAAVAFSLWRAVFLSDLLKDNDERLTHLDLFLESLIADNTVVYATDKRSREWTFQYTCPMRGFACPISLRGLPTISWTWLSSSGARITRKRNGPTRNAFSRTR